MAVDGKVAEDVKELVQSELSQITNRKLREALRAFLVTPTFQMRNWDYSTTNEVLACWIVADFRERDMGLAYSELGHGIRAIIGALFCSRTTTLAETTLGSYDSRTLSSTQGSGMDLFPMIMRYLSLSMTYRVLEAQLGAKLRATRNSLTTIRIQVL
jgi:hypothetical protein